MLTESANSTDMAGALAALRADLARLGERVAALERTGAPKAPAAAEPAPAEAGVTEELVLVISAAVAAFLGKKAPIRQIRLTGSGAWAQQGRVIIQASHVLSHG
jgi:methylmalonyl-CoA carboxyltransferase large subunit